MPSINKGTLCTNKLAFPAKQAWSVMRGTELQSRTLQYLMDLHSASVMMDTSGWRAQKVSAMSAVQRQMFQSDEGGSSSSFIITVTHVTSHLFPLQHTVFTLKDSVRKILCFSFQWSKNGDWQTVVELSPGSTTGSASIYRTWIQQPHF